MCYLTEPFNTSRHASFSSKENGVSDNVIVCAKLPSPYSNISEMSEEASYEDRLTVAKDSEMNNIIFKKSSQV